MKSTVNLLLLIFGVLLANVAHAESPREQLHQLVEQLQQTPNDNALRERIIRLAPTLKPSPAVPASPAAAQPAPKITPPPKADPVMTEELMERLIKYTRAGTAVGSISAKMCAVLELCDGTKIMPLQMAKSEATDAGHYFALPLNVDSKDILFTVDTPLVAYLYLTDKTGRLRAAAISENGSVHLITNEKAAEKFKHELSMYAGEAAGLSPSGPPAPGNS